jgi:low affinity Fe/Cu permease
MERNEAAESRKSVDGRTTFERFTESVNQKVSRAPFFLLCMVLVTLWLLSVPLWHDLISWQSFIQTISAVLSLLLLVLLENSGRRAEEAAQEKLNVLAEGLAALMESQPHQTPQLEKATRKLSEAVNLESRH